MKRLIAYLTASMFILFATAFATLADTTYKYGDVNQDGVLSINDATDTQRYLAGYFNFTRDMLILSDVDDDNDVSIMDVTLIQMYLARLVDDFPANNEVAPTTPTTPPTDSDGYYDQVVKP